MRRKRPQAGDRAIPSDCESLKSRAAMFAEAGDFRKRTSLSH